MRAPTPGGSMYRTEVVRQRAFAKDTADAITEKANEMELQGWQLVTSSLVYGTPMKIALVFWRDSKQGSEQSTQAAS